MHGSWHICVTWLHVALVMMSSGHPCDVLTSLSCDVLTPHCEMSRRIIAMSWLHCHDLVSLQCLDILVCVDASLYVFTSLSFLTTIVRQDVETHWCDVLTSLWWLDIVVSLHLYTNTICVSMCRRITVCRVIIATSLTHHCHVFDASFYVST